MIGLVLTFALTAGALQEPASQPSVTFRAQVQRVYVDVFVERDGRPVEGLKAEDFVVLDDGVKKEEILLLDPNDYPLSVVLVLDTSESVRGPTLEQLKSAAQAFVRGLHARDQVGLISFGSLYQLRKRLDRKSVAPGEAIDSIDSMVARGGTALFDSLYAALVHAESGAGRPLVVLFSDGDDNLSRLSMNEVQNAARNSNAVVYAIGATSAAGLYLGSTPRSGTAVVASPSQAFGKSVLSRVAEPTGGRMIEIGSASGLTRVFLEILEEMRSRYLLFFEPEAGSRKGWHSLEIRLKEKEGTVRARRGYFHR